MPESISFLPFWDALTRFQKSAAHQFNSIFIQKYEMGTVNPIQ